MFEFCPFPIIKGGVLVEYRYKSFQKGPDKVRRWLLKKFLDSRFWSSNAEVYRKSDGVSQILWKCLLNVGQRTSWGPTETDVDFHGLFLRYLFNGN